MPEPIPEPTNYADALISGLAKIRDYITEWSRSTEHETPDIPLAGGWVVGAINEQIERFESEPGLREQMELMGPVLMRMLAEARDGDVRGEH